MSLSKAQLSDCSFPRALARHSRGADLADGAQSSKGVTTSRYAFRGICLLAITTGYDRPRQDHYRKLCLQRLVQEMLRYLVRGSLVRCFVVAR
jgi:hypothetical protein